MLPKGVAMPFAKRLEALIGSYGFRLGSGLEAFLS
ncbi:hypothetical protein OIU77_006227 [Salix suchowensis]|uniref:Uncharacterized protein n=1 Tax=Salix suchowensis TaxID=1278906 RepID=A0ABQ9AL53_9ROSI|nr:hypothetical protein OIU77_006227 [Salix suchowensis]